MYSRNFQFRPWQKTIKNYQPYIEISNFDQSFLRPKFRDPGYFWSQLLLDLSWARILRTWLNDLVKLPGHLTMVK